MATAQLPEEITEGLSGLTIRDPDPAIRMGLLNVRSIKNLKQKKKREMLRDIIENRKLEVFFSTETWLTSDSEALRKASPKDYKVFHQSREQGEGGGVGIQISSEFTEVTTVTTFEYVAKKLKHNNWDQEVLFINLYRPPSSSEVQFLAEFKGLLEKKKVSEHPSVVITGDFNIWVDVADDGKNKRQPNAKKFMNLLAKFKFLQHVDEATHKEGHTLDLVISRNVEISDLTVHPCDWSDHKLIVFKAKPKARVTGEKLKKT